MGKNPFLGCDGAARSVSVMIPVCMFRSRLTGFLFLVVILKKRRRRMLNARDLWTSNALRKAQSTIYP